MNSARASEIKTGNLLLVYDDLGSVWEMCGVVQSIAPDTEQKHCLRFECLRGMDSPDGAKTLCITVPCKELCLVIRQ